MALPASQVLEDDSVGVLAPACEHYAGSAPKAQKILGLWLAQASTGRDSFDITLDLEDGASAAGVDSALGLVHDLGLAVAEAVQAAQKVGLAGIAGLGLRLPAAQHPHHAQVLQALAHSPLALYVQRITLPKVGGLTSLEDALLQLRDISRDTGWPALAELPVQVLVECHGSLRDAFALAAHPRVSSLSFGIMDFVSAHRGALPSAAMASPLQFSHPIMVRAKAEIVAACAAHGKIAVHNPSVHYNDVGQTLADAQAARGMGFQRMWSIHPAQIEPIGQAFRPTAHELEEALAVLQLAAQADWAPIAFQGRLHDRASYRYFWRVLKAADPAKAALFS